MKNTSALLATLFLCACASTAPRIIQPDMAAKEIHLSAGTATQIEMPSRSRVVNVTIGNPILVSAEKDADVVNLIAKGGTGSTNVIIRSSDSDGDITVFQYRIIVD